MPGEPSFKEAFWLDPSIPCSLGIDDCTFCSASQYDDDRLAPEEWSISPWAAPPNTSTTARATADLSAAASREPDPDQRHCESLTDFKDKSECIDPCRLMQATETFRDHLGVSSGGTVSAEDCLNEGGRELAGTAPNRTLQKKYDLDSSSSPAEDLPASATTASTPETITTGSLQAQCEWHGLQDFSWVRNNRTREEVMVPHKVLTEMTTSTHEVTQLLWAAGWRVDIKTPRTQAKEQARLGSFVGRLAKATAQSYRDVDFTPEQLNTDLRHLTSHESILMTQFKLVRGHNPAWKEDETEPS